MNLDPETIRRGALALAKLKGCTCPAEVAPLTGPIQPGQIIHLDTYHDDNCPLIRSRARHLN